MPKLQQIGSSIECSKSKVFVRKISTSTPVKITDLSGKEILLHKYKTKKRAIVSIAQELAPKACVICNTSNLDLHDELEAEVIEIYTNGRSNFQVISNFSHVHGIQGGDINSFTYARIVIPWRYVLQSQLTAG